MKSCSVFLLVSLGFLLSSCYPTEERGQIPSDKLVEGRTMEVPTKIHMQDGSVVLCEDGFKFLRDTLHAYGIRYSLSRSDSSSGEWSVPLDSVVGLEYIDTHIRGARVPASALLGLTVSSELAIGSLFLLKAIFGSCPTIYTSDSTGEQLQAECFSYSIGRKFKMDDIDRIHAIPSSQNSVSIRLKNEALETHYIDRFRLFYADHPTGTELFPTGTGEVLSTSRQQPPIRATNVEGRDILASVVRRDSLAYSCTTEEARRLLTDKHNDWIECEVVPPDGASKMVITLRVRNSLENTVLLYDVMMRNQGLNALAWTDDVNNSLWYAWKLSRWYSEFSGIHLLVEEDGSYSTAGNIFDTGPIAWKDVAIQSEVPDEADTVKFRLSFLPDNWKIDWIGISFDEGKPVALRPATCVGVGGSNTPDAPETITAIENDDESYLVTYPGESRDLSFSCDPMDAANKMQRSYFLQTSGYYVEWIRPEWVRDRGPVPGFDLSNRDSISQRLTDLWLAKRNSFEADFFRNRIPSWSDGGRQ